MKVFVLALLAISLGGLARTSFGLIAADALVGIRSASLKTGSQSNSVNGSVLKAAVHLDPIPLVPVSFGLGLASVSTSSTASVPSGTGFEVGAEVKAWLPFVPILTPYARLSYVFLGAYSFDGTVLGQQVKSVYDVSGALFAVGAEWSPIPLVGVLAEVAFGTLELDPTKIEQNGQEISGASSSSNFEVTDLMVGVSIGI